MNRSAPPLLIKLTAVSAGILGCLLRALVYITGTDEKGLLVAGPWNNCLLLLTLAAGVGLLLFRRSFPASSGSAALSKAGAPGCFLLGLLLARDGLFRLHRGSAVLDTLTLVFTAAAALSLLYVGFCRLRGRRPLCLGHALVCICFALRMVGQYRIWSSDPQLMDYAFLMAGYAGLMLTGYRLAAHDAGIGQLRDLWTVGLATVYLCLAGLYQAESPLLLLAGALWVLTGLPAPREE